MYGGAMGKSYYQRVISGIGAVFNPEKLDELPEIRVDRGRVSFFSWLLKSEVLPMADEAKESGERSFFSWLFASETLTTDQPAARGSARPSFLTVLFSRERLPDNSPPGPVPGNSGYKG
jgi:hypothetical protein